MQLFTTSNCPACEQIKRFCSDDIEIINLDNSPEYIGKYNLMKVPALVDNDEVIIELDVIMEKIR